MSTGSGNCSEWDALRQPGGALANVNYYHCQGGCGRLYGEECYCPGANYPSQRSVTSVTGSLFPMFLPGDYPNFFLVPTAVNSYSSIDDDDGSSIPRRARGNGKSFRLKLLGELVLFIKSLVLLDLEVMTWVS